MKTHISKAIIFSLFLTVPLFSWPVIASEPGFKEVPCSMFDDEDDLMTFAFWLDGYITGTQKKSIFNQKAIEPLLEATVTSCQSNPEKAVFQVVSDLKSS
ncbi:HdeA/HdeB family chaperone [Kiloniella sp. EL199]|uniref:HdeA/HdeB family chaperone n=1 Tax=Kiloniella sp. EL199 TaxID=2107581 RepID=UPI000EA32B1E|nr:HdeA/HdeB family chaperone [Kiloniella sp. EL199]